MASELSGTLSSSQSAWRAEDFGYVAIRIPGPPCAQGRGRAVRMAKGVRVIDPERSRTWKATAQAHMAAAGAPVLTGAVEVIVRAAFACPTSDYRKRPVERRWHAKAQGDADNVAKAVLDAGTGVLWLDDRQVARLVVEKVIAAQGEPPAVGVLVRSLEGERCPRA